MRTAEEIITELQKSPEYVTMSWLELTSLACTIYGNQQLDNAAQIAIDFDKELIAEKIIDLKD